MGGGSSLALAPGLELSPPAPGSSQLTTTSLDHSCLWAFIPWPPALLDMRVFPDILGESSKPQPPSCQLKGPRWHFPHDVIELKHPHGKTRGQEGTGDTVTHGRAHVPCSAALWAMSQHGTSAATETFAPFSKQQQGWGAAGAGGRGFGVEDKGPHRQGTTCSLLLDPLLNMEPPQTQCGDQGWPCAMLSQLGEGPDAAAVGRAPVSSRGLQQVELEDFSDMWL